MDLLDFGRTCEMFENLLPFVRQINDVAEGFGSSYNAGGLASFSNPWSYLPIPNGDSRRVLTPLLLPSFQAQKLLPLALIVGLVIELELDTLDAVIQNDNPKDTDPVSWEIVQPMILVDSVQVDPALSSSYAKNLFEGKTLPISYHNFYSMQVPPAFSRL